MFQPGLTEAIVSRRIAERFQGLDIGDKFRVQATDYTVVGLFEAGGKASESEIWVDVESLGNATKRDRLHFGSVAGERPVNPGGSGEANY